MTTDNETLTDYELASRWGVSTQALYQRRRKNLGPPFKMDAGVPRYRLATVVQWERKGKAILPRRRNG